MLLAAGHIEPRAEFSEITAVGRTAAEAAEEADGMESTNDRKGNRSRFIVLKAVGWVLDDKVDNLLQHGKGAVGPLVLATDSGGERDGVEALTANSDRTICEILERQE